MSFKDVPLSESGYVVHLYKLVPDGKIQLGFLTLADAPSLSWY